MFLLSFFVIRIITFPIDELFVFSLLFLFVFFFPKPDNSIELCFADIRKVIVVLKNYFGDDKKGTPYICIVIIIYDTSKNDNKNICNIYSIPYLFGYKLILAISQDPKLLTQKINLINMNCKSIILGYKPRAIFVLEVYHLP